MRIWVETKRDQETLALIRTLIQTLSATSRLRLAYELDILVNPFGVGKRFGSTAQAIVSFLDGREEFVVEELLKNYPDVPVKSIYNAIGYLARKGVLSHVSYGKYRVSKK